MRRRNDITDAEFVEAMMLEDDDENLFSGILNRDMDSKEVSRMKFWSNKLKFWSRKQNSLHESNPADLAPRDNARCIEMAGEKFYVRPMRTLPQETVSEEAKKVELEIVDQYQIRMPSGRVLYGGRLENKAQNPESNKPEK